MRAVFLRERRDPDVAHGLQRRALGPSTITVLALLALWQAPGCLVPPDVEGEVENLPPELDFKATVPSGFSITFDRQLDTQIDFSLQNAVVDPENDELFFVWYWQVPGDAPRPFGSGGEAETLTPCEYSKLQLASTVYVAVWVSDERIRFDMENDSLPVQYEERLPIARFWTVDLLNACTSP